MNRYLIASVMMAVLGVGPLASAQTALSSDDVTINRNQGQLSGFLNTDVDWQTIEIPLSAIGNVPLDQLSLSSSGLPEGLSVSLGRASYEGATLLLNVDVNRSNSNVVAHGLATLTLTAGGTALVTFQVPVAYVAWISQE